MYNHLKKEYMMHKYIMSAIIAIALFISPVLQAQQEPTGGGWFDSYSLPSFQSILEKTQDTVNWMKETVKEHPRKSFVLGVGALALFGAAYFLMHKQKSQEDTAQESKKNVKEEEEKDVKISENVKKGKNVVQEKIEGTTYKSDTPYDNINNFADAFIAKLEKAESLPLIFTGAIVTGTVNTYPVSIVAKEAEEEEEEEEEEEAKEKTYDLTITFNNDDDNKKEYYSISKDKIGTTITNSYNIKRSTELDVVEKQHSKIEVK